MWSSCQKKTLFFLSIANRHWSIQLFPQSHHQTHHTSFKMNSFIRNSCNTFLRRKRTLSLLHLSRTFGCLQLFAQRFLKLCLTFCKLHTQTEKQLPDKLHKLHAKSEISCRVERNTPNHILSFFILYACLTQHLTNHNHQKCSACNHSLPFVTCLLRRYSSIFFPKTCLDQSLEASFILWYMIEVFCQLSLHNRHIDTGSCVVVLWSSWWNLCI